MKTETEEIESLQKQLGGLAIATAFAIAILFYGVIDARRQIILLKRELAAVGVVERTTP